MLTLHHRQEFIDSAINPALAELNFHSTDDNWFIRHWLNWKPQQRWKGCPFDSGWYCHTLDPRTGMSRSWGPFKPDAPLLDTTKGKARKYEHPAGSDTLPIFLKVDRTTWEAIARRHGVPIVPILLRLRDRNPYPHFWEWVRTYQLPIIICEGAKKAAALLSAGYVAIALPGVWNGRRKRQGQIPERLIPDLQYLATPNQPIYFCFDHDPKFKTQQHVSHALIRTGKLFAAAGCQVHVIRLPGPEKGVDDFIVARGAESFDQLYLDAVSLSIYERQCQHRLRGHSLTYPIALDLNQRYLLPLTPAPSTSNNFNPHHPAVAASVLLAPPPSPLPLPATGVIALLSDMGTGKTELLKQMKAAHPTARILNLGHRIALLRNLSARLGTAIYSDYGWNMWQEPALSLTADSLHKLKTEGNTYDIICLDECEQFIQHLLCSSTCKEHRHAILQALKHFIYSAQCVVLSDAHLSDLSLQFILAMRPDPHETPFVIRNCYKNGDRRVFWYEGKDRSAIVRQIKVALFLNSRVIVACDGLEFSKDLSETLQPLFPDKRIVCINSDTSNEPWARSLIEHINQPGMLADIDCLIYSPSVNTGVSIDTPHFDQVFGVFGGGALAGTDCLQALNRYRPKVDWHVWVGPNPIGGYRPTSPERIKRHQLQVNDLGGFLLQIVPGSGVKTVADEFAWDAWAAIQARRHESLNNLRGDVQYLIQAQGHRLIPLGEATDWDTRDELKAARELNRETRVRGICNAARISATEARRLEAKDRPTLQDYYQLERYRIESSWGREIDAELVALDNGGRTLRQFILLEALLEPPAEVSQVKGKRIFFPPALVAQKDLAERQKFHALDWRNDAVAWSVRQELNLPALIDPQRQYRNDDRDLVELAQKAQRNALILKDLLGITIRRNATPIQILQQLLEQVGLKLICVRKEGGRGEQVRVYQLDPVQWALAQEVLQYRRSKREMQAQKELEVDTESVVTGSFFANSLNKGGDVTTALAVVNLPAEPLPDGRDGPPVWPPELAEGVAMLQQAVELNDPGTLQTVWNCWDEAQRTSLLAVVSAELKQQVLVGLGQMAETVTQWTRQVGDWVDETMDTLLPETRGEGEQEWADGWEGQPLY